MFTDTTGRLQPIWAFLLSVAFSAAALVGSQYLAYALVGDRTLPFELIFRTTLAALLLAVYLWLITVADHVEENQLRVLGLGWRVGSLRQFFSGTLVGAVLTAMAVLPILIAAKSNVHVRFTAHMLPRILTVVAVLLAGALAEELMFRGYPFQHLVQAVGSRAAVALFSLMFGLMHLFNPGATWLGLINTVVIGIVLSIAYLRTRSLWVPWGIHFGWNFTLGFVFGLPVSGLRLFNVVVRTSVSGPRWLTGGAYGTEAAATGATAVLAGLLLAWKFPFPRLKRRQQRSIPVESASEAEHPDTVPGIQS